MQKDEVLDDHTWKNLVWKDMARSELWLKDRLGQLEGSTFNVQLQRQVIRKNCI